MNDPFAGVGFAGAKGQESKKDPFEGKGFEGAELAPSQDPFAGKGFQREPQEIDDGTELPWYLDNIVRGVALGTYALDKAPEALGKGAAAVASGAVRLLKDAGAFGRSAMSPPEENVVEQGVEGVVQAAKATPTIAQQVAKGMELEWLTRPYEMPPMARVLERKLGEEGALPVGEEVTAGDMLETPRAQQALREFKELEGELKALAPENPIAEKMFNFAVSVQQSLPAVMASVATKRPSVGLLEMYAQTSAQEYGALLSKGVKPEVAKPLSQMTGLIESGTELLPLGYLIKNLGSDTVKTLFRYTLLEFGQEGSSELLQALLDKAVLYPNLTTREIVARTLAGGFQGMLAAPIVGSVGRAQYRMQEAAKKLPRKSQEVLDALGDKALGAVPPLRRYVQRKERERLRELLAKDLGLWEEYKAATEKKQSALREKVDSGLVDEIPESVFEEAEKRAGSYVERLTESQVAELTQLGFRDTSGEVVDFANLPEGRVVVLDALAELEEVYRKNEGSGAASPYHEERLRRIIDTGRLMQQRIVPQLQALMDKLGRKKPLVVFDSATIRALRGSPTFSYLYDHVLDTPTNLGFALTMGPFDFVYLNTDRLGTHAETTGSVESSILDAAVHELGHTELIETFQKLPKEDQTRLVKLWLQSKQRAEAAVSADTFMAELAKNYKNHRYGDLTPDELREHDPAYVRYITSFAEWLANRFAETVRADGSLQPEADKFSKAIYRKWRRMYTSIPQREDYDFRDFTKLMALNEELLQVHEEIKKRRMVLEGLEAEDEQVRKVATEIAKTLTEIGVDEYVDPTDDTTPDLPEGMPKKVRDELTNFHRVAKYGYTITQLAKINPHLKGLQKYVETVERKWWVDKMRWLTEADEVLRDWVKLGTERADVLGRFLLDLTVLSEREGKRFYPQDVEYFELVKLWNLDQEQQALAMRVEQMFVDALDMMESVRMEEVRREYKDDPVVQEQQLAKVRQEINELRKKNYFPLARFGQHIVVVKALAPYYDEVTGKQVKVGDIAEVRMFEKESEAAKFHEEMNAREGFIASKGYLLEEMQPLVQMPGQLLAFFEKSLELTPQQREQLKLLRLEMSPANSFLKRLKERKVTPGWSQDAMRAFAQYFQSFSGHMARLRWKADMLDAIKEVREYGKKLNWYGGDSRKVDQVAEFMENHLEYIMNPGNEWASLRAFAFIFHLGLVPKSALVNATQVPMVALPYLSARYGEPAAVAELARQAGRVWYTIRSPHKLSEGERAMLEELKRLGIIDESMATEVAAIGEGTSLSTLMVSDRKGQMFVRDLAGKAAWMFQTVEKLNRRLVALAAYNLARKRGLPQAKAVRKAYEAVADTQYEYAYWDRPRFMRGRTSTIFVFWMYMQKTIFQMTHDKSAARMWLLWLFVGGLSGLPFAEDLMDLIDFVIRKGKKWLGRGDPYFNLRVELRKLIAELGLNPDLVMHGVSRDVMGVDLSGSLSLGRVIPFVEPLFGRTGDFDSRLFAAAEQTSGAVWTIPLGLVQAAASDDPDLLRRWGSALPAFGRNIAKSVKIAEEGGITLPDGAVLVEYDMRKPEAIIRTVLQGMGFTATAETRAKEEFYTTQEAVQYYESLRRAKLWRLAEAVRSGDTKGREAAMEDIRRFNDYVPYWPMRISGSAIRQALRGRLRQRALEENYGVRAPRERAIQEDFAPAFPR